jgi:hypothetical protein
MTLNEILHGAQGGKAVDNIAAQYGLSAADAEKAVQAMIPAFSAALQQIVSNPAAMAGVLKELASGDHAASYAPGQAPASGAAGSDALGRIFGSPQAVEMVVQHVSQVSGVSPDIVRSMLPAVASILIGGLAHAMASLGLSGVLSQLADAVSAPGGAGQAVAPASGSGNGVIGSLIGSLFGGAHPTANPETAALAAGLATLSAMFVSGVQVAQANQASMSAIAQSFAQPPPGAGV